MPRRAMTTCPVPSCPNLSHGGRCEECRREADRARGSAASRGYGKRHRLRFRKAVLARDICCRICQDKGLWVLAVVADHWPRSRRELVEQGLDADDPQYGRGLCTSCHSRVTQLNPDQAGGFNRRE